MYQTIIYNTCKYEDLICKNVGVGQGAVRVKNDLKMSGISSRHVLGLYLTSREVNLDALPGTAEWRVTLSTQILIITISCERFDIFTPNFQGMLISWGAILG